LHLAVDEHGQSPRSLRIVVHEQARKCIGTRDGASRIGLAMHLRMPSIARGVTSFAWAFFFFLFIWIGGIAVGFSSATCFIVGAVAGFLSFLFVRVYGEDEPRRP